jgi:hypothetical protein
MEQAQTAMYLFSEEEMTKLAKAGPGETYQHFRRKLIDLYKAVLVFLTKTIVHLRHKTPTQMLADATVNEWKKLASDIEGARKHCQELAPSLRFTAQQGDQARMDQMLKEIKDILKRKFNNDSEIVKWASGVDVQASHKAVQSLIGSFFTENAGIWFDGSENSPLRKWLLSGDPFFWLIGSGEWKSAIRPRNTLREGPNLTCSREREKLDHVSFFFKFKFLYPPLYGLLPLECFQQCKATVRDNPRRLSDKYYSTD